jgi:hypothetical protein
VPNLKHDVFCFEILKKVIAGAASGQLAAMIFQRQIIAQVCNTKFVAIRMQQLLRLGKFVRSAAVKKPVG